MQPIRGDERRDSCIGNRPPTNPVRKRSSDRPGGAPRTPAVLPTSTHPAMTAHLTFACACLLSASLAAQVPTDAIVVLDWFSAGPFGANQFTFVDPNGGGVTEVPGVTPFGTAPVPALAVDPASADEFYFLGQPSFPLAGIQKVPVGVMALPGPPGSVGSFPGGERMRIDSGFAYTLTAGAVERTSLGSGATAFVRQQANAIDIDVRGSLLWIACADPANPATPAPLLEVDLTTGATRTITLLPNMRRIAIDPTVTQLAVGTDTAVLDIAVATGAVLLTIPVVAAPVVAVAFTSQGDIVRGESPGFGYTIYRGNLPAPIAGHGLASLTDLVVASAVTPSAIPFGSGCGNGSVVTWDVNGLPRLGSAGFGMSIAGAPGGSLGAAFFGDSRTFSSVHASPLPMDLAMIGAPGCPLLVDPLAAVLLTVDPSGSAAVAQPIPANPALAGLEWVGQAFVFDPSLTPYPFAAAGGIALRINP